MASPLPLSWGTIVGFRVAGGLCHSLAFIVTVFRLIHRRRRKQFSWDDFWALVAVSCNNVVHICFWLRIVDSDKTSAGHPPTKAAARIHYYVMSLAFTCTLWTARISVACSILRILPPRRTRRLVFVMAYLFGITTFFMLFFKGWICGHNDSWFTDCPLGEGYSIAKLTAVIVADVGLVVVPLYLLWHTSLPKGPRYMIRAVFATSIATAAISAMHVCYDLGPNQVLDSFTAHLESAVTVMVCNLLVVVTFFYRRFRNGHDLDDDVTAYLTTQQSRPRAPITFMTFAGLSHSRPATYLSAMRRGSSLFLEEIPSTNAAHNNHPPFDSNLSSVDSRKVDSRESTKDKTVKNDDAVLSPKPVDATETQPLPPSVQP